MKVEIKKIDAVKRLITVNVAGDGFAEEKKKIYLDSAKELKVPGFRPGAAPVDVLEKHHGSFLRDQFLEKALPIFYSEALKEANIIPAGYPKIYDVEVLEDGLNFKAELEAKPEFEITDKVYKGIKIKEDDAKVKDSEIDKVLENLKSTSKKALERDLSDDEVARWASYSDLKALKEAVTKELAVEKLHIRRDKIHQQIIEYLLKGVDIELPKGQVERQHKELLEREINNLRSQGINDQDIEKYKKDIDEKLKSLAQDQVKLFYVLEAVAAKENLKHENNLTDVVVSYILSQAEYK